MNFRSRIFVWFLSSFLNPLFILIFWAAVILDKGNILPGWNLSTISVFYLLVVVANSFIIVHIDEDVAIRDIREGQLTAYVLKPFSYFWSKFLSEIGWRIMQGFFALLVLLIFFMFFKNIITFPNTVLGIISTILIVILALLISFVFKMILGLTAFWFVDFWGLQQLVEVVLIVLAGIIIPIELYPGWLKNIALSTPFPYMVYYPILSFQSRLINAEIINVILIQLFWILLLSLFYKFLWSKGIKKFTGVGE